MAADKIGGVLLSTYGLRLARLEGHLDLPAYKKVIDEHDFPDNLRVLQEKTVKAKLLGIYSTKIELGVKVKLFADKLNSAVYHSWDFPAHGFVQNCIAKDGAKVAITGTVAEIDIQLTVIG
jgi:hypothetical protein